MATDAEIRSWALANDVHVSAKGRVGYDTREAYDAAHPSANGAPAAAAVPDYPPGMTEDDFVLDQADDPPGPGEAADTGEAPPARPKPRGSRSMADGLRRLRRPAAKGRSGTRPKARPRVPVDDLIGSAWRVASKLAQPIPPLYRTLRIQSPIAGLLLEDAVKGTAADTVLQPLARLTSVSQTASALLLPPAAITALAMHTQQSGGQPNPLITQACLEALRHGLMAMMRVGGPKFTEVLDRERREEEEFGATVDELLAWLLAPPADPAAEEAGIAAMAARMAGREPEPEPAGV